MAGSVNKVTLIGNLARDPEIRKFDSGGEVANMRLITSESWNDKKSGERRERSEGHNIVIYNERLIDVVSKYCKKGDKLYIEGALTTRKYTDKNGNDAYATEIVLQQYRGELQMLGSPGGAGGEGGGDQYYDSNSDNRGGGGGSRGGGGDRGGRNDDRGGDRGGSRGGGGNVGGGNRGGFADDLDDDVPF
jgi:single-strand DNA-binding protein